MCVYSEEGQPSRPKHRATNMCFGILSLYILTYEYKNLTVNLHVATKSGLVAIYYKELSSYFKSHCDHTDRIANRRY